MNLCFFSGLIISEIDFKFIISRKMNFKDNLHFSISTFKIKLDESTIITIKAYDELADFSYEKLKKGDIISISGRINDKNEVEIEFIQKIK